MAAIMTSAFMQDMLLGALRDSAYPDDGLLLGSTVALYSNDYSPTFDSVIGDFTLINSNGVVPTAFLLSGIYQDSQNRQLIAGEQLEFEHDSTAGDLVAYGYVIYQTSTTPDAALIAERFPDGPVALNSDGQYVTVAPRCSLSYNSSEVGAVIDF